MIMEAYQERVVQELKDLQDKYDKLAAFMQQASYRALDKPEQARLAKQYVIMGQYIGVLKDRIAHFK